MKFKGLGKESAKMLWNKIKAELFNKSVTDVKVSGKTVTVTKGVVRVLDGIIFYHYSSKNTSCSKKWFIEFGKNSTCMQPFRRIVQALEFLDGNICHSKNLHGNIGSVIGAGMLMTAGA